MNLDLQTPPAIEHYEFADLLDLSRENQFPKFVTTNPVISAEKKLEQISAAPQHGLE